MFKQITLSEIQGPKHEYRYSKSLKHTHTHTHTHTLKNVFIQTHTQRF